MANIGDIVGLLQFKNLNCIEALSFLKTCSNIFKFF